MVSSLRPSTELKPRARRLLLGNGVMLKVKSQWWLDKGKAEYRRWWSGEQREKELERERTKH